jgi:hypothetical protein
MPLTLAKKDRIAQISIVTIESHHGNGLLAMFTF